MGWSEYWVQRARRAADHQRMVYDLEVPPTLGRLLQQETPRLTFLDGLRVMGVIGFGSLRGRLRLFGHRLADLDTPAQCRRIEGMARELARRLSDKSRLGIGSFERRNAGRDMARVPLFVEKMLFRTSPLLVVQPAQESDVLAAMAFARERRIPVFPRGISSSAFGGAVPTRNGLVLDFSAMMEILRIDSKALTVRVQPGVRWADLASCLERIGLAPVTTPSSIFSTVGGWASTGGLGIGSFGYGHFSSAIASARVALMNGKVLELTGDNLGDFTGTEGQLGIFTELTLRVRRKPDFSSPRLVYFEGAPAALEFVGRLTARGHRPAHVVFYDRQRMAEENRLFRDRTGSDHSVVEERDAVLLHFDDADAERRFLNAAESTSATTGGGRAAASYLWAERFFPLKAQRLGPGLLAGEVVLPRESVPHFLDRARRAAWLSGVEPAAEVIVSRPEGSSASCVVIVSFPCDPNLRGSYLLRLLLVQTLVFLGVRMRGRAYGLGIWNAPFISGSYPAEDRRRLLGRKQESDPHHLLNPNKFFGLRTRFLNLPGLLFSPPVFRTSLRLASALTPLLGAVARIGHPTPGHRWVPPAPEEEEGRGLLAEASLRCTSCGSCISACPAYLLTRDELVTGRAKLRMAESWLSGGEIGKDEAHRPFQCLDCGLCEEVCQTRLPLRDCYRVLERWIERRQGYPGELVRDFVKRLDEDRGLIKTVFGLGLPDWSPDGPAPELREIRRSMEARP